MVNISDDLLNNIKPMVIISVTVFQFWVQAIIWFTILTKRGFTIGPLFVVITIIFFAVPNYYLCIRNNKWEKYFKEFEHYSKSKKVLWDSLIVLIIFGTFAFTIFSFYEMSQIDWSKYRH